MRSEFVVYGATADWCDVIYHDLIKKQEGLYIDGKMLTTGFLCRILYSLIYVRMKVKSIMLKNVLYSMIDRKIKKQEIDLKYAVFHDWNRLAYDVYYLQHLKKVYRNVKLVFIFTNIYEKSGTNRFSSLNYIKQNYDLILMYDETDAKQNGLVYYPTVYSKIQTKIEKEECDVFYVGNAKDRLPMLLLIYQRLSGEGLKCLFFINGVRPEEQKYKEHIHYNQLISYKEVISYIRNAKCILDIGQQGSNAITLRCCEAIFYEKRLITTASKIANEDFFYPHNIYIVDEENVDGLNMFLNSTETVRYDIEIMERFMTKRLLSFIKGTLN